MDRGIISISETGAVTMPTTPVWMTKFEITNLFGVFSCDIRKAIHSIYKNRELDKVETMKYIKQPDGISYDVYNLEMIINRLNMILSLLHILNATAIITSML